MNLRELAIRDAKRITTNKSTGFGTDLVLTAPDGLTTLTIQGLATRHSLATDTNGNAVNKRTVHCSFAMSLLDEENYPFRDGDKIMLKKHKVAWTDATGISKTYIIEDWMPDDTLGLIVLRLGDLTA